ncbi:MAG: 4Fe-4S binding protein [Candidatus Rokubacteria bacterium]|nr:4Fe-4S binding protein [Candidatus Rokubacteria bacterium]
MIGRAPILPQPAKVRGLVFIKKNQCKGCELCIEFCPKSVLVRSKGFNPKGYHYPIVTNGECINCRLCVTVCPEYAIFSVAAASRVKGPGAAATTNGGRA